LRHREKNNPLILGIDPGSHSCGYGIIKANGNDLKYITSGKIVLSSRSPLHIRLKELHDTLTAIIRQYKPAEAVVEKIFFSKSARSALSLGHARGVALVVAAAEGLPVHEYTAVEVKKAVTGYGRAEKRQVQEMLRSILSINGCLSPDGADALALALCHINRAWFNKAVNLR
jgi:crossover junction endodeoxyribonuclease RuvC